MVGYFEAVSHQVICLRMALPQAVEYMPESGCGPLFFLG